MQSRVEHPLADAEQILGHGLDRARDFITIHFAIGQKTQHHELGDTGHERGVSIGHDSYTLPHEVWYQNSCDPESSRRFGGAPPLLEYRLLLRCPCLNPT